MLERPERPSSSVILTQSGKLRESLGCHNDWRALLAFKAQRQRMLNAWPCTGQISPVNSCYFPANVHNTLAEKHQLLCFTTEASGSQINEMILLWS